MTDDKKVDQIDQKLPLPTIGVPAADQKSAPAPPAENVTLPPPPPRHPSTQSPAVPGAYIDSKAKGADQADRSGQSGASGLLKKALSSADGGKHGTATRFFSAYAQTWVGLSPIMLMYEAVTPGKKVGSQFSKGGKKLFNVGEEIRNIVATNSQDIVVIIDEKIKNSGDGSTSKMAERTAEVVKAAGERAILVVTTSLDKLSTQFSDATTDTSGVTKGGKDSKGPSNMKHFDMSKLANDPQLKASLHRHGRDALVLLDGALAHPVVVTGVAQFARTRGIPHADALLRLARLGLGRILATIPEADAEALQNKADERLEAHIEEIDAEELERVSSTADRAEAEMVGRAAEKAADPKVESNPQGDQDPYEGMRKRSGCVIM